jgi:hypothetical protein
MSTENQATSAFAGKKTMTPGYYPGRAGLAQSAIRMSTALNATPEGTNDETKSDAPVPVKEDKEPELSNYSWVVLALIVSVRIVYQW